MSVLSSAAQDRGDVDWSDAERIREIVKKLMGRQEALHEDILQRVSTEHQRSRKDASREVLRVFHAGDYVLVVGPIEVNQIMDT